MDVHIWPFVGIALLVIIAPGPDTVLVTKNAVLHGRGAALGTSLGVNTGLMIWTLAAAFGVATLVRESEVAFTILRLVGAVYLVYLGAQALRASRRHAAGEPIAAVDLSRRGGALLGFRQGVMSNLANPKIAVFFTSLLPQFVSSREPVLLPFLVLGSVFVLMTLIWLCSYALLASRISDVLTRPRVRTALDRLTGVVLIGLGIRLALERR